MPINITWVDHCEGSEVIESIQTPAVTVKVHLRGDVITQIDWVYAGNQESVTHGEGQLAEFWPGINKTINIKLLKQGTPFRNKVWEELLKIPFGKTLTYSGLAKNIGSAARAVGNACRDNPYPLIIPCHRVVAVNGMGGFNGHRHGAFMELKAKLLDYEANYTPCKTPH
ncbi:MAG: methylated-DNA--[protein]-cysteine S-methyltransferase [Gammaproteobacteria bacterium]|nr:methylated-DNA--[protein]-cysteine S-methyltransferase [Gammaproteobacteria bacterium]